MRLECQREFLDIDMKHKRVQALAVYAADGVLSISFGVLVSAANSGKGLVVAISLPVAFGLCALLLAPSPVSRLGRARGHSGMQLSIIVCFVMTLTILVADVGAFMRSDSNARFSILLLPLILILAQLTGGRARRPHRLDEIAMVFLVAYTFTGIFVAITVTGTSDNAAVLAFPLLFALVGILDGPQLSDRAAKGLLLAVSLGSSLYLFLHLTSRWFPQLVNGGSYSHEKAFVVVAAITSSVLLKKWWLVAVNGALTVFVIADYPAATYPIALITGLLGAGLTHTRTRKWCGRSLSLLAGAYLVALTVYLPNATAAVTKYLLAVGKDNTAGTRLGLIEEAMKQIALDPVLGSAFTGGTTMTAVLSGKTQSIPVHNDVLQFLMLGGLVALVPLAVWIARTVWIATGAAASSNARGGKTLAAVLSSTIIAALAVSASNPVLFNLSSAAFIYSSVGLLSVLFEQKRMDPNAGVLTNGSDTLARLNAGSPSVPIREAPMSQNRRGK